MRKAHVGGNTENMPNMIRRPVWGSQGSRARSCSSRWWGDRPATQTQAPTCSPGPLLCSPPVTAHKMPTPDLQGFPTTSSPHLWGVLHFNSVLTLSTWRCIGSHRVTLSPTSCSHPLQVSPQAQVVTCTSHRPAVNLRFQRPQLRLLIG